MLFFLASSRFAAVIAAFDAGNGFADGDNRGGAVAAEMGEFDGLEAHWDFLIYSWPETNVTGSHLHSRRLGRSPEHRDVRVNAFGLFTVRPRRLFGLGMKKIQR